MPSSRIKTGAFVLEGLNSISTTFYFYFVYWFLTGSLQFGSRENLIWAVGHGAVYVVASLKGGNYGQRHGYLRALKIGFLGMSTCFFLAWLTHLSGLPRMIEITVQAVLMLLATVSICFTWPNLEAMVSEGEPGPRLQRLIGIYNLVWSGCGAFAYFIGGALFEWLGGHHLTLLIPAVMIAIQWGFTHWLSRQPGADLRPHATSHGALGSEQERHRTKIPPRTFLVMSWLANPCAYVAINTAVPLIPSLAARLGLEPRIAGFFCSIWLFARTATFLGLWRWTGWHYRFRWLVAAFIGTILGFLFIFLTAGFESLDRTQILVTVTVAQLVFGMGLGLIYYSSLFYSMDVGDTKGDHGGIHEAAIGAGILGGPLVGAAAQFARPGNPYASAWAVGAVLCLGLGVLVALRYRRPQN
ncbi:MAG: MFS transporter [Verrucomicrobiales bacterium]|nr:MFS transporter [Verrucomicrobiales bacterium]